MQPEFSRVPFRDPAKAESNIERLTQKLASSVLVPLASLLMPSPDPDGTLNLLDRYAQACPPEVLGAIARTPTALTYLVAVFGYSTFLAETLLAEPALAVQFARDRNFTKLKSQEDLMQDFARFTTTNPDPWLSSQLARFKRRNYLRIALKDVLGLSTLGETTLELSSLADVILANALSFSDQELSKRYGRPQFRDPQGRIARSGFSVVSLGKLGGNELNYSSDIDLLFLYFRDGETSGGAERSSIIANKEYFVRLAHAVTRTVTQTTPHGQVFRVDLRLRPEGEQGDLAISLKSALEYYKHRARDWELQMLIKARHSAGDARLTRDFLRGVEPYVYGAPTDFAAVESVLWAREKISPRLRESRGTAIDVKRHRGGIRDIEFLTQCLQRLYGRDDRWVRSGGTLHALRKLNDKGQLGDREFADLTTSYEFLRQLEHCLQLDRGQQTHRLPADPAALDRLARRVDPDGSGRGSHPGPALLDRLQKTFDRVDEIYQRVIHPRAGAASRAAFGLQPPPSLPADQGVHSYEVTLSFLEAQAPELAAVVKDASLSERARPAAARLFAALLGTSERFALARQQPQRLKRALEVMATSDYLAELLIRHPEDLATFNSIGSAFFDSVELGPEVRPAPADQMEIPLDRAGQLSPPEPFTWATEGNLDLRQQMAVLRRQYRAGVMTLGARDVTGLDSVFASLARWSALASQAIATALRVAAGPPGPSATAPEMPLAVLGLGRLGLQEFDLGSDADLVFIAPAGASRDDIARWTHFAERTIDILSSYTSDGTVFAVDTRVRPRGQEGELVVTEDALSSYVARDAHVWEALTYLKACPVTGNRELAAQVVERLLLGVFDRFAGYPQLEAELHQMRRRLEREVMVPPSNTKTAPGGYYDVDFAVSYLRLRHRVELPAGANSPEQVAALRGRNLIGPEDERTLVEGAAFLRSVDHAIRLVTGRTADGLPEHVGHAEAVEDLARRWKLTVDGQSLAERLRETQDDVRYAYRRLVGSE
jgi:[glutamine synthetase] adenylyltransferase / [glutamine synthetase]-adenylyl-L-tyrosine phosphorylase